MKIMLTIDILQSTCMENYVVMNEYVLKSMNFYM